jgi:integrase
MNWAMLVLLTGSVDNFLTPGSSLARRGLPGEDGDPISTRTLSHVWSKARKAAGRPDLRLHDLRHSGLTWAAATGASVA